MADDLHFTLEQSLKVRARLRDRLGMGEERFDMRDFARMLGDEIDQMHAAGHDDAEIAHIVEAETGVRIEPGALTQAMDAARDGNGR